MKSSNFSLKQLFHPVLLACLAQSYLSVLCRPTTVPFSLVAALSEHCCVPPYQLVYHSVLMVVSVRLLVLVNRHYFSLTPSF